MRGSEAGNTRISVKILLPLECFITQSLSQVTKVSRMAWRIKPKARLGADERKNELSGSLTWAYMGPHCFLRDGSGTITITITEWSHCKSGKETKTESSRLPSGNGAKTSFAKTERKRKRLVDSAKSYCNILGSYWLLKVGTRPCT